MDPLNVDLVLHASERLGSDNVGLSTSGVFVDDIIDKLQGKISDIEVTLDAAPFDYYKARPIGYHEYAGNGLINLKKHGFTVGAQTVLTKNNIVPSVINRLFDWLCENNIDKWSLLRFFPSGRGSKFADLTPTYDEYCEVVKHIKSISQNSSDLFVHFQYLLPNHDSYTLSCRAVKRSFGILPDGTVISCFWALDKDNRPMTEEFNLGRVPFQHINDILTSNKANRWRSCESCKIFSN